jgi:hypothetical protein
VEGKEKKVGVSAAYVVIGCAYLMMKENRKYTKGEYGRCP